MLKTILSCLLIPALLTTLTACDLGDLQLFAKFDKLSGLKADDRIIYQNGYIGDVEKITLSDHGHYLVELDIDKDHKKKVTDLSIFYINDDPDIPGRKAVFTAQERPGGTPLVYDSVVNGLDHPPFLLNMLENLSRKARELGTGLTDQLFVQLKNSLAELEEKMQQLEEAIRATPESDEARELARNIDKLLSDLESTMERVKTMIGDDLLKTLRDSLDGFRKRLEELDRKYGPSPGVNGEGQSIRI
jgi:ABC-type transporter Mla subunit MlaD